MHDLVLRGGTVVDADGARAADVAVSGSDIAAVDDGSLGDAREELDAGGQFVAPGLIDAHVHVGFDGRADPTTARADPPARLAYRAAANLEAALEAGVTTVRDLGSAGGVAIQAREAVAAGEIEGPRVLAAGQNITVTGGHGHWFGREADGPDEVRKAAREQLKAGADLLKCMATGGVLTEGAVTGAPEFALEELEALVGVASARSVPTAAHAHGRAGIENAARAGVSSVEHGTFMDRKTAELLADRGTYWVPTTKALSGIIDNGVEAGIPEWAVEKAEDAADDHAAAFEHALAAGVPVAMGTDAGTPFNFHADSPAELELMVERGLSPAGALEAATVNAADLLGLADVGLVREGHRADLVVLEANPLEDPTAWQGPARVLAAGDLVG